MSAFLCKCTNGVCFKFDQTCNNEVYNHSDRTFGRMNLSTVTGLHLILMSVALLTTLFARRVFKISHIHQSHFVNSICTLCALVYFVFACPEWCPPFTLVCVCINSLCIFHYYIYAITKLQHYGSPLTLIYRVCPILEKLNFELVQYINIW